MSPLIILIFIAFAVIIFAAGWYFEQKRRQFWQDMALRYGLRYSSQDPFGIPQRYHQFAVFQTGRSRRAYNCLHGDYEGRFVLLFDYRYTTGSGKDKKTRRLSALIMDVGIPCNYLLIRPESFFDKIGAFLGYDDIDFEFDEFNRRFHVQGDKRFAYDICHSKTMDYLLQNERLTWEMSGNHVILYGLGTFDEREIGYCLDRADAFVSLIPDYLHKG